MKKRLFLLFFIIAIFISGCTNRINDDGINGIIEQNPLNELISIYNINDELINQFNVYGSIHLTNDSFIYSKMTDGQIDEITSIDYFRYNFETKETIKLGSINGWYYESRYNTTFVNNQLYMLVTNVVANEYIIGLYRIDLDKNNLTMIYSEKNVGMYNSMTVVGDKLFITKLLNSGGCDLEEYNTKTNERKNIYHFEYDNNINTGTVIRQITADENTISFLLLKLETEKNVSLYTNIYDYDMNLLETVKLDVVSRDKTELQQPVACFYIANDFIYYENFSTTRFFGKINENISESIMEQNGNFSMISELDKNRKDWVIYEMFTNGVYLINTLDGEVNKIEYYSNADERYYITYMLRAGNDNILIVMDYQDPNTGDKLPKKIYYLNLSDLEFQH